MIQSEERRRCERVAFLRSIAYLVERSDRFVRATMLNFCSTGICFQSAPPVAPGDRIHILTEEDPLGTLYDKTGEAIYGEVMWCRKKAGAHQVGVHYLGDNALFDGEGRVGIESRAAYGYEH